MKPKQRTVYLSDEAFEFFKAEAEKRNLLQSRGHSAGKPSVSALLEQIGLENISLIPELKNPGAVGDALELESEAVRKYDDRDEEEKKELMDDMLTMAQALWNVPIEDDGPSLA